MGIPTPMPRTTRRMALIATAALLGRMPFALAQDAADSKHQEEPKCPGHLNMEGYGEVHVVPNGWENVAVIDSSVANPQLGGRAYFADTCTAGHFDNEQYLALNLLGKTMSFTTDVSGAGCGCNAAFYLTSMRQNTKASDCFDYYCDANNVCGVSCAEIDIMEANMAAWHSTQHSAHDHDGKGAGYGGGSESRYAGWNGPRQWTPDQYGPDRRCIDTHKPFQVSVSFPTNEQGTLEALEVMLTQEGKDCPLAVTITDYAGNVELTSALAQGMTPIMSYWSDDGMLWLDGEGADHKGPCHIDHADRCGESVKFYDFAIRKVSGGAVTKEDLKGSNVALVPAPAASSQAPVPWWQAPTTTEAAVTIVDDQWTPGLAAQTALRSGSLASASSISGCDALEALMQASVEQYCQTDRKVTCVWGDTSKCSAQDYCNGQSKDCGYVEDNDFVKFDGYTCSVTSSARALLAGSVSCNPTLTPLAVSMIVIGAVSVLCFAGCLLRCLCRRR